MALAGALIGVVSATNASAATTTSAGTHTPCTQIEVIAARGSDEPGSVGPMLTPIAAGIAKGTSASSTIYGVPYPATVFTIDSSSRGTTLVADRVKARAKTCPRMKFVLLGYSQGSIVIDDALAGRPFGLFPPEIPPSLRPRIAAVVLLANGYYRAGMPYNRGTAATQNPGVGSAFPDVASAMKPFAHRLADFCNANDPVCQGSPKGGFDGHGQYAKYQKSAIDFVLRKLAR